MKFSRRYKLFAPIEQARGAATALAELRVQRYKQEIAATMAETAYGSQDPYTQAMRKQLQAVSEQQERAESQPGLAGEFSITNVGSDIALEYTRLFADVEVHTRMKAYIAPLLEQARQDIHRATPALYVLDPAIAPNKKDRPKRSLIVAGTAFGSFILALLYVILRDRFLSLRAQYRAIVAEEAEKNKRT